MIDTILKENCDGIRKLWEKREYVWSFLIDKFKSVNLKIILFLFYKIGRIMIFYVRGVILYFINKDFYMIFYK